MSLVQSVQGGDHRQAAHQLRDDSELEQIVGLYLLEHRGSIPLLLTLDVRAEANGLFVQALLDDLLHPVESAAADEEDILGVDLDELLVGMLAAALGRNVGHSTLQDFQQGLLHALARHVAGNGGVLTLAGDLVDLVHVDDAALSQLDVVVGSLHQSQEDVLHVVAHISGLGEGSGVGDGEGHLQNPGQGLGEQGLAAARRPHEQDVALLELHVLPAAEVDALIVVVDRHGQGDFSVLLPDDILVQHVADLPHIGDVRPGLLLGIVSVVQNAHAQVDTLVADIGARTGDDAGDLFLVLAAEGTAHGFALVIFRHGLLPQVFLRLRGSGAFASPLPLLDFIAYK